MFILCKNMWLCVFFVCIFSSVHCQDDCHTMYERVHPTHSFYRPDNFYNFKCSEGYLRRSVYTLQMIMSGEAASVLIRVPTSGGASVAWQHNSCTLFPLYFITTMRLFDMGTGWKTFYSERKLRKSNDHELICVLHSFYYDIYEKILRHEENILLTHFRIWSL